MENLRRMNFSQFVDKVFWILLVVLANSIAKEVGSINENIKILNEKMAMVMVTVSNQDKRLDALDLRLNYFETRRVR